MGRLIKMIPLEQNQSDKATTLWFYASENGKTMSIVQRVTNKLGSTEEMEVVLKPEEMQEIIRVSIGNLFPMNHVDDVLLTRSFSDQVLAHIKENENQLIEMSASIDGFLRGVRGGCKDGLSQHNVSLVRSCIAIAIMSLRSVEGNSPVQGDRP